MEDQAGNWSLYNIAWMAFKRGHCGRRTDWKLENLDIANTEQ